MMRINKFLIVALFVLSAANNVSASPVETNLLYLCDSTYGTDYWLYRSCVYDWDMLDLYKINYTVMDGNGFTLTQSYLDGFDAVMVNSKILRWGSWSPTEENLLGANAKAGNITLLIAVPSDSGPLNSTIFSYLDFAVNSSGNFVYWGNFTPFSVSGTYPKTMGTSYGNIILAGYAWNILERDDSASACWLKDLAVDMRSRFFQSAFGIEANLRMPLASLRIDDIGLLSSSFTPTLQSFIEDNAGRIRSTGYLVGKTSGSWTNNASKKAAENNWSLWGDIGSHGWQHETVDDWSMTFEDQYDNLSMWNDYILGNYSDVRGVIARPMNQWNNDTIVAQNLTGFHYFTAQYETALQQLYNDSFDTPEGVERQKMYYRYQPNLDYNSPMRTENSTDKYTNYNVDWQHPFDAISYNMTYEVCRTKIPTGFQNNFATHGNLIYDNEATMITNLRNLMTEIEKYDYVRWVTNYELMKDLEAYEDASTIITVDDVAHSVNFTITSPEEIDFLTLRVTKTGYVIDNVTVDGAQWNYYVLGYVFMPRFSGTVEVIVNLSTSSSTPHVVFLSPTQYLENTGQGDRFNFTISMRGSDENKSKIVVENAGHIFMGNASVWKNIVVAGGNNVTLESTISGDEVVAESNFTVIPSSDYVNVTMFEWGSEYRRWNEYADNHSIITEHVIGGFAPGMDILIVANGVVFANYTANSTGYISFIYNGGYSEVVFEATTPPTITISTPINTTYSQNQRNITWFNLTFSEPVNYTTITVDGYGNRMVWLNNARF